MVNLSRAILPLEFSFWDPRHHHASPVKCYLIDVNLMLFTFFFGCSSMFQLAAGHLFSTKAALTCSGARSTPNPTLALAKWAKHLRWETQSLPSGNQTWLAWKSPINGHSSCTIIYTWGVFQIPASHVWLYQKVCVFPSFPYSSK